MIDGKRLIVVFTTRSRLLKAMMESKTKREKKGRRFDPGMLPRGALAQW